MQQYSSNNRGEIVCLSNSHRRLFVTVVKLCELVRVDGIEYSNIAASLHFSGELIDFAASVRIQFRIRTF